MVHKWNLFLSRHVASKGERRSANILIGKLEGKRSPGMLKRTFESVRCI